MFAQAKPLTAEEEQSLKKYDISEFRFPYKKVNGDYSYLRKLN